MVRRPGDKTAEPPGGRAAERLRMFELARAPTETAPDQPTEKKKSRKGTKAHAPLKQGRHTDAKQDRRKV
jgi:hypothetical protein